MEASLKEKLWNYIIDNNPDLMFSLQENYAVLKYLQDKIEQVIPLLNRLKAKHEPDYVIEECCLNELTKELRPSRFNYIKEILQENFEDRLQSFMENGVLTYEIINMIEACSAVFAHYQFSEETEGNKEMMYAVIGMVGGYLDVLEQSV